MSVRSGPYGPATATLWVGKYLPQLPLWTSILSADGYAIAGCDSNLIPPAPGSARPHPTHHLQAMVCYDHVMSLKDKPLETVTRADINDLIVTRQRESR